MQAVSRAPWFDETATSSFFSNFVHNVHEVLKHQYLENYSRYRGEKKRKRKKKKGGKKRKKKKEKDADSSSGKC